jgi:ribosomal protein S12 methylthiotransferase
MKPRTPTISCHFPKNKHSKALFYIESLGCAKNQVDSETLIARLESRGYGYTEDAGAARYILVNTCGFIESAKQESIDTVFRLRQRYPRKKLLMVGCLVERYGRELAADLPEVDGFMGNRDLYDVENLFRLVDRGERPLLQPDAFGDGGTLRRTRLLSYPGSAYVKLSEGCRNNCSYCAIPLIRGPLRSRPAADIVKEVTTLLKAGIREIVFIAQDLSSYGLDRGRTELVPLVKMILKNPHDFWLRLLYIHPDRFPPDLPGIMKQDPRVLPYFDLPFQHAAPAVLKAMGRSGDADTYLRLIDFIRAGCEGAVIRSTFLVGFPGESNEDFTRLLDFQRRASLNWAGVFEYSREEGTPAAGFKGPVKKETARVRRERLEQAQQSISETWLDTMVGRELDVLVEEKVKNEALFLGRAYVHAPEVDGLVVVGGRWPVSGGREPLPGHNSRVRITGRNGLDLEGVFC